MRAVWSPFMQFGPFIVRGGAPSLSDFYGTGPGQIAGDWRVDDPIYWPSTSFMQTARNDGGTGALIELTGPESTRQITMTGQEGAKYAFSTSATIRTATFSPNSPDAAGVHSLVVALFGTVDYTLSNPSYLGASSIVEGTTNTTGNVLSMGLTFPFDVPTQTFHLVEVRYSSQGVTVYLDGINLGTQAKALSQLLIADLKMSSSWGFGRVMSVVCDDVNHSATNLEPAVLLARQTLAAQYGVTL